MDRATCLLLAMATSLMMVAVLAAPSRLDQLTSPYPMWCDQPRRGKCAHDYRPHCLKGRKEPVFGHCEYLKAVCDEEAEYDPSFSCDLH